MKTYTERGCPICGGEGELLRPMRFVLPQGHPLQEGYNVVACRDCRFVYADMLATQAGYDRFYAEQSKYDDVSTSTGGGGTPEDAQRLQETAAQIAALVPEKNSRILDVGCATGGLLHALGEFGLTNVLGLDPSPSSREYARDHFNVEVRTGSLFQHEGLERADVVILSHVLEHVLDLQGAMQAILGLLRSGGCLYLEVPDSRSYKDHLIAPFQDFNTEHINHFSLDSLDRLCAAYGFSLLSSGAKVLVASADANYPAIWGWWVLDGKHSASQGKDEALVEDIQTYIAASQAMLDGYDEAIRAEVADNSPIAVWGAGQLTLRLLTETSLQAANITCFVDGNPGKQGKTLVGRPILAPEALRGRSDKILVASAIHQQAIVRRIRQELMLENPLILLRPEASA